jgi:predicted double-glycine peptidase
MTEVINAYGHHYRVTDILKVESQIGEITPELGLLEEAGVARTVAHFGFKTTWGHNLSLNDVINVANHGRPVIVSFPPDRYAGGHLLVVTGGDANYVYLADSSLWNRHSLSRNQFLQWWEGFYAIVTPK